MSLRARNLELLGDGDFDVFIVGGGINGAVSAAALAARGAQVAVVDRADFGGHTSQSSSNLVWGGFKYLENYELGLVRKLCKSRNRLIAAYPDSIAEIRFTAALDRSSPYSPPFAALGAAAYWAIGSFATRRPELLAPAALKRREPVIDITGVRGGIEYSDAYLRDNDSRFVFAFIRSALNVGAVAANYVDVVDAERRNNRWHLGLVDRESGSRIDTTARVLVNAAGPFADGLNDRLNWRTGHRLVFSKGIHLIVDRLTQDTRVLAFYDDTQRLFYVIPMGARSMIGTTDTRVEDPNAEVEAEDRRFLLDQINARLDLPRPLDESDIIAERCGVRPLVVTQSGDDRVDTDWTALSRKHEIEANADLAAITVFGGKLTDCLNVGEEVAEEVERLGVSLLPDRSGWYGEPPAETRAEFFRQSRLMKLDSHRTRPGLEPLTNRLWRRYGIRAFAMLEAIRDDPSMAQDIMENADYLRVELHLAARTEMVTRLEDFLRRRSKIAQVVRHDVVHRSRGLREACEILFGSDADARIVEYFGAGTPSI